MKYLVIVSHANFAESLVRTAAMICGESVVEGIKTFCMREDTNAEDFRDEVQKYVDEDPEGEYFVLADLYAASPCTSSVMVLGYYTYRLVTGVNLGMLLEVILNFENCTLEELEEKAIAAGKEGVNSFYLHA